MSGRFQSPGAAGQSVFRGVGEGRYRARVLEPTEKWRREYERIESADSDIQIHFRIIKFTYASALEELTDRE